MTKFEQWEFLGKESECAECTLVSRVVGIHRWIIYTPLNNVDNVNNVNNANHVNNVRYLHYLHYLYLFFTAFAT